MVPIFPGLHDMARVTIAPLGDHAAGLVITSSGPSQATNYELVQQAVPAGSVVTSMPLANSVEQDEHMLGWSVQPLGIFFQQAPVDVSATSQVTSLWFAAVGTAGPPVLVETITGARVAFAPTDEIAHVESILG
jgi:hypothetical protein